ncbi:MAG TPA: cytochrome c [Gemmatimonadales bacterium]|nr:cytochrome c [Gemmatimonadales bacterium]
MRLVPLAPFAALALALVSTLAGCQREARRFRETPPAATASPLVTDDPLQPGPVVISATARSPYEENAYAVSQGEQLYNQLNCVGCHAHGGGSYGPPLMDDEWIYGSEPENIFETIVEGRPNGMPAWRGKLSNQQVWQLVAYVRSLSGLLRPDVAPGRPDHMEARSMPQATTPARPRQSFQPPASTHP